MADLHLLCRAARRLHEVWQNKSAQALPRADHLLDRAFARQQDLVEARTRLDKARLHGLMLILPILGEDVLAHVDGLRRASAAYAEALAAPVPVPSIPELISELRQVEDEFGELHIDLRHKIIRVHTDPITLEDVYLGPFAIQLYWPRLVQDAGVECFDMIALQPNPPTVNESVTHPHVKHQKLCAGDATVPLKRAMEQGRLADAFCLIRGVLTHYNSSSPHVSLEEWDGLECSDCSSTMSSSDASHCDVCDNATCSDCSYDCGNCSRVMCGNCVGRCAICAGSFCDDCLKKSAHSRRSCCPCCAASCSLCQKAFAKGELNRDTQRCPECQAKIASTQPQSIAQETPDESEDPIEAAC